MTSLLNELANNVIVKSFQHSWMVKEENFAWWRLRTLFRSETPEKSFCMGGVVKGVSALIKLKFDLFAVFFEVSLNVVILFL